MEESNDYLNKYSFSVEAIFARIKGPKSDPVGYEERSIPQMFFDQSDNDSGFAIVNEDDQVRVPIFVADTALEFNGGRGVYSPFDSGLLDQSDSTGLQLKFNVERKDGIGFELGGLAIWPSVEAV